MRHPAEPFARSASGCARGRAAMAALVLGLALAAARDARADSSSELEKAHNAYVAHHYEDAATRLRALLDPKTGPLKDPDTVADARMYLGATLLAQGKKADADAVFQQLLRDKPEYQPDPLRVSLQATDALIDARSRMRDELAASMAEKVRQAQEEKAKIDLERQKAALRLQMLEKLASEETVVHENSRWIGALPFGVGQFQNGQKALGWTFLVGEGLLLAGSGVAHVITLYNEDQANEANVSGAGTQFQYRSRAEDAYVTANVFTAAFVAAAIAGVVHAQLTFVPEEVEVRHRDLPPVSLSPVVVPLFAGDAAESRRADVRAAGDRPVGAVLGVLGHF
ncbi:MAG TPA: hypothetical protein VHV30_04840 [Polyangiaceae bacterium]|nr:hypothetical protein [Polyangiaceae bacterium]